ncbi:MAG TPA: DUF6798 domain-containing protein [Verrucomicrobiae bacterium]|nr:DUF6798 domain-containing protein [Verrucomicrobiae bacterium]
MKRPAAAALATPAVCLGLALLSFFQFPGHTWLQQDSQIYVPILEHERDPAVLRNDILVERSQVAYTLYDEIAIGLRDATGLGFREVLAGEQIATRALGIWGLVMLAEALGLAWMPAVAAAAICALGALIKGPEVLTFEYEPTPRAFAVPLLICGMGLAARRRYLAASVAAGAAILFHAPTALPVLCVSLLLARRVRPLVLLPLAGASAILLLAAHGQHTHQDLFAAVTPPQEMLQHLRTAYVWVSTWPAAIVLRHLLIFAALAAACARLWRAMTAELRLFLLVLPALGLLSMPLSRLLLEHWKWGLVPQVQPMRALLFTTLAMQLATAAAGFSAKSRWEKGLWFILAYWPPCQSVLAVGLAVVTVVSPIAVLAAFFLIPTIGHVTNYPRLHTPELAQVSAWARANTPQDAVFLFPDEGHGLAPGIFRSEALRAVYVDWKGGGQVNYLRDFGEDWWFRWQQTVARGYRPGDLGRYSGLGVNYVVLRRPIGDSPVFENKGLFVYSCTAQR